MPIGLVTRLSAYIGTGRASHGPAPGRVGLPTDPKANLEAQPEFRKQFARMRQDPASGPNHFWFHYGSHPELGHPLSWFESNPAAALLNHRPDIGSSEDDHIYMVMFDRPPLSAQKHEDTEFLGSKAAKDHAQAAKHTRIVKVLGASTLRDVVLAIDSLTGRRRVPYSQHSVARELDLTPFFANIPLSKDIAPLRPKFRIRSTIFRWHPPAATLDAQVQQILLDAFQHGISTWALRRALQPYIAQAAKSTLPATQETLAQLRQDLRAAASRSRRHHRHASRASLLPGVAQAR